MTDAGEVYRIARSFRNMNVAERIERTILAVPGISSRDLQLVFGTYGVSFASRLYGMGIVRTRYSPDGYRCMHILTSRSALPDGDLYLTKYEREVRQWRR